MPLRLGTTGARDRSRRRTGRSGGCSAGFGRVTVAAFSRARTEENVTISAGGVPGSPIELSSAPGTRATLIGRLWVADSANDVSVADLDLDGVNAERLPEPDRERRPCPVPPRRRDERPHGDLLRPWLGEVRSRDRRPPRGQQDPRLRRAAAHESRARRLSRGVARGDRQAELDLFERRPRDPALSGCSTIPDRAERDRRERNGDHRQRRLRPEELLAPLLGERDPPQRHLELDGQVQRRILVGRGAGSGQRRGARPASGTEPAARSATRPAC